MKEDKMHLINKIFNNETIRTVWDKEEEKYYISIVDIVGVISESKDLQRKGMKPLQIVTLWNLKLKMGNIVWLMWLI